MSRSRRRRQDPRTPDIHKKCSKRGFDGQVKAWRKQLHALFPSTANDQQGLKEATPSRQASEPQRRRAEKKLSSDLDYIFAVPSSSEPRAPGGVKDAAAEEGDDLGLYDDL